MRCLLVALLLVACNDHGKTPPIGDPDAPAATDPCDACAAGALCVQRFDGTCALETACVTPTASCPQNACSADCQTAYCPSPYQCMTRSPCGKPISPKAFTCFGP